MTKTKPMTPEMLQEIQEFPDSMGMGHLVREIERCWQQLQAANAVCEMVGVFEELSPERLTPLIKAWRATQKGGK